MAFMRLTELSDFTDVGSGVLLNPALLSHVRVHSVKASDHSPARATLLVRVHQGSALEVLAIDSNGTDLSPARAAEMDPTELLRMFAHIARQV